MGIIKKMVTDTNAVAQEKGKIIEREKLAYECMQIGLDRTIILGHTVVISCIVSRSNVCMCANCTDR